MMIEIAHGGFNTIDTVYEPDGFPPAAIWSCSSSVDYKDSHVVYLTCHLPNRAQNHHWVDILRWKA